MPCWFDLNGAEQGFSTGEEFVRFVWPVRSEAKIQPSFPIVSGLNLAFRTPHSGHVDASCRDFVDLEPSFRHNQALLSVLMVPEVQDDLGQSGSCT